MLQARADVATVVKKAKYYSITTDAWSSQTMEPYLSPTTHFLDVDFTLHTKCIAMTYFPDNHTGKRIKTFKICVQL